MKRQLSRRLALIPSALLLGLISGCDDEGVLDIIFGSLQLAFGIVDVAT